MSISDLRTIHETAIKMTPFEVNALPQKDRRLLVNVLDAFANHSRLAFTNEEIAGLKERLADLRPQPKPSGGIWTKLLVVLGFRVSEKKVKEAIRRAHQLAIPGTKSSIEATPAHYLQLQEFKEQMIQRIDLEIWSLEREKSDEIPQGAKDAARSAKAYQKMRQFCESLRKNNAEEALDRIWKYRFEAPEATREELERALDGLKECLNGELVVQKVQEAEFFDDPDTWFKSEFEKKVLGQLPDQVRAGLQGKDYLKYYRSAYEKPDAFKKTNEKLISIMRIAEERARKIAGSESEAMRRTQAKIDRLEQIEKHLALIDVWSEEMDEYLNLGEISPRSHEIYHKVLQGLEAKHG